MVSIILLQPFLDKTCILTMFSFSCFDHNHLVIRDVKSSSSMQIVTLNHQDCNLNSRPEWIFLVYVQGLFASEIQQKICVIGVWIALTTLVPSRAHLFLRMHYSRDTQRLSRASACRHHELCTTCPTCGTIKAGREMISKLEADIKRTTSE